jgi:RNA polymerase sigma-70 factor (ECF subfamily)
VAELGEQFPAVLSAAVAGDVEAFGVLWRSAHPMLLRYLRVLCGEAAEDVASETWLRAIAKLGSFHGDEQGFRGWLVVIARNHARDVHRHAARRPETLSPDLSEHQMIITPDPAELVLERAGTEAALRLVATLPPDQAEMVALRVVVGLDVADVARIVGRSPGAVRVAVHRGLRTLAGHLRDGSPITPVTLTATEALSRRDV